MFKLLALNGEAALTMFIIGFAIGVVFTVILFLPAGGRLDRKKGRKRVRRPENPQFQKPSNQVRRRLRYFRDHDKL